MKEMKATMMWLCCMKFLPRNDSRMPAVRLYHCAMLSYENIFRSYVIIIVYIFFTFLGKEKSTCPSGTSSAFQAFKAKLLIEISNR